jgi:transposase
MLGVLTSKSTKAPVSESYEGKQIVGIDLHRRRLVLVRMTEAGEALETVRISNDLRQVMARAGEHPEVVLEATYGWYWAADVLAELSASVHLAHPLGVKMFSYRRVKNDQRDAHDLADLLRMERLPQAWIAPPAVRGLRELVRHRAKLVAVRSSVKCQVHAVLAGAGVSVVMSDLFGVGGQQLLQRVALLVPIPPDLHPACRAGNTVPETVLHDLRKSGGDVAGVDIGRGRAARILLAAVSGQALEQVNDADRAGRGVETRRTRSNRAYLRSPASFGFGGGVVVRGWAV